MCAGVELRGEPMSAGRESEAKYADCSPATLRRSLGQLAPAVLVVAGLCRFSRSGGFRWRGLGGAARAGGVRGGVPQSTGLAKLGAIDALAAAAGAFQRPVAEAHGNLSDGGFEAFGACAGDVDGGGGGGFLEGAAAGGGVDPVGGDGLDAESDPDQTDAAQGKDDRTCAPEERGIVAEVGAPAGVVAVGALGLFGESFAPNGGEFSRHACGPRRARGRVKRPIGFYRLAVGGGAEFPFDKR